MTSGKLMLHHMTPLSFSIFSYATGLKQIVHLEVRNKTMTDFDNSRGAAGSNQTSAAPVTETGILTCCQLCHKASINPDFTFWYQAVHQTCRPCFETDSRREFFNASQNLIINPCRHTLYLKSFSWFYWFEKYTQNLRCVADTV